MTKFTDFQFRGYVGKIVDNTVVIYADEFRMSNSNGLAYNDILAHIFEFAGVKKNIIHTVDLFLLQAGLPCVRSGQAAVEFIWCSDLKITQ